MISGTDNSRRRRDDLRRRNDGRHDHQRRRLVHLHHSRQIEIRDLLVRRFRHEEAFHVEDTDAVKLVSLAEQSNALDEVVVIGYGTQKKESMVASITSVKPSDLNITSSSLTTAFAGNIAGMISRQTSGEPGYDSASFYIRGISTFGSSNSPLIILDGVEVLSNMLNNMPPESIRVVLGAQGRQATSVYGSRGANGVILINTKKRPQLGEDERLGPSGKHLLEPTMVQQMADGVTSHAALQRGRLQHRQGDRNAPTPTSRSTRPTRSTARRRGSTSTSIRTTTGTT